MKSIIIFVAFLVSVVAQPALAQLDASSLTTPELQIELKPEYPQPGELVTATINDYSGGAYGAGITWILDGQVITEAENQRSAQITAGDDNSTQQIQVVLQKPQGGREVLQTVIQPIYLDLVIEPQTRVPDFYLGRSLPSEGSIINATAVISGSRFSSDNLMYTWRINNTALSGGPVRGGSKTSFTMPLGQTAILTLQVTTLTGTVVSSRAFSIPSVYPMLKFYEVNSLYGMSQRELLSPAVLTGNSLSLRAEPYFLDSRIYNNPAISKWSVNNYPSDTVGSNPYEVTIQRMDDSGFANLDFHVRDTTRVLQGAQKTIQINY